MSSDPSVSPADTIRRLREEADASELGLAFMEGEDDLIADTVEDIALRRAAADNIAALLAVGERDKAESAKWEKRAWNAETRAAKMEAERVRDGRQIARLTEALEQIAGNPRGGSAVGIARAVLADEEDAG